ncbi:hypothetical protein WME94_53960 [Sorangium sp. So ce429]
MVEPFKISFAWAPRPEPLGAAALAGEEEIFLALLRFVARYDGSFTVSVGAHEARFELDLDLSTVFRELPDVLEGLLAEGGGPAVIDFFDQSADLGIRLERRGGVILVRFEQAPGTSRRYARLPAGPIPVAAGELLGAWAAFLDAVLDALLAREPALSADESFRLYRARVLRVREAAAAVPPPPGAAGDLASSSIPGRSEGDRGAGRAAAVVARLQAVDWATVGPLRRSRVALMREFLRRSALWSEVLGCPDRWPFFDIAGAAGAQAPLPELPAELASRVLSPRSRDTIRWMLRWAAAPPPALPGLPEPYEPLLLFYERGGGFTVENRMVNVGLAGIPLHDRTAYVRPLPFVELDPAALDALDAGSGGPR